MNSEGWKILGIILSLVGILIQAAGFAFWLGKMQGRVNALETENARMAKKQEKLETRVDELTQKVLQETSATKIEVKNLSHVTEALHTKIDGLADKVLGAVLSALENRAS